MKTYLSLLLVLLVTSVHSQSKLLEGYLVNNEGDTLRGYFKDGVPNWNAKTIQFSKSQSSLTDYALTSFKEMYVKEYNEHFIVRTVDIDKKPIRVNELETTSEKKIVSETILLQQLVGGKMDLFKYADENGKIHFFVQKDGKLEELGYVRYFSGGNLGVLRFYIGTLTNLTSDCDKVKVGKVDYTEKGLTPIVTKYNSCFGEVKEYVKEEEKIKISLGVLAGGKFSSYKYNGVDNVMSEAANNINFTSSINPLAGIYLDLIPRGSRPFVPGIQLMYQEAGVFEGAAQSIDTRASYDTKLTYISSGIFLKVFLIKNRRPPFFAKVGAGYNQLISEKVHGVASSISRNVVLRDKSYADFSYGVNLHAGVGLSYQRLITEIRFQNDLFFGVGFAKGSSISVALTVGCKLF